jgi:hypothetical protein
MKERYLIIGNAETTPMLEWVKALVRYYDLDIISFKTTHGSIHDLLPEDHLFNLDLNISGEDGNYNLLFEFFQTKKIIKKKAIFPGAIHKFVEHLNSLTT